MPKAKLHVLYKNEIEIAKGTVKDISQQTGITIAMLHHYKKSPIKPKLRRVAVNLGDGEYAIYQGDDLIMDGTLQEVATALGVDEKTIMYYTTPTTQRRAERSYERHKAKVKYFLGEI